MLQDTGGAGVLGGMVGVLVVLALVLGVLWTILPFAIFGIKGLLRNLIDEQKRTTAAITSLRNDLRALAREPAPVVRGRSLGSSSGAETMVERR